MKLGVNYSRGHFEWLAAWHVHGVISVLDALDSNYRYEGESVAALSDRRSPRCDLWRRRGKQVPSCASMESPMPTTATPLWDMRHMT